MPLDVRTIIPTVEQTLWDLLSLGYEVRLAPVADLAGLRAAPAQTVRDRALRYVTADGNLWRWSQASTAADNGTTVIAPTTAPYAPAGNGRWLRVSSPATFGPNRFAPLQAKQTGYARSIILYQGEGRGATPKEVAESLFGQSPAMLLQWLGDDARARSQYAGALYWNVLEFQVLCYSECLRGRPAGLLGSPLAGEAAKDPGLQRMVGDVRYLLAGVQTGVDGIESVEIGRSDVLSEDEEERIFIGAVQVLVRTSFAIPDEDLETHEHRGRPEVDRLPAPEVRPPELRGQRPDRHHGPGPDPDGGPRVRLHRRRGPEHDAGQRDLRRHQRHLPRP